MNSFRTGRVAAKRSMPSSRNRRKLHYSTPNTGNGSNQSSSRTSNIWPDGAFSSVYKATWIDGPRHIDRDNIVYLKRTRLPNTVVVLKVANVPDWSGNNGNNVTAEFLNEVGVIIM